jgi:hypothetical protein
MSRFEGISPRGRVVGNARVGIARQALISAQILLSIVLFTGSISLGAQFPVAILAARYFDSLIAGSDTTGAMPAIAACAVTIATAVVAVWSATRDLSRLDVAAVLRIDRAP